MPQEAERSIGPRHLIAGGTLAALASGALMAAGAEPADAYQTPEAAVVTVESGDSPWSLLDENTPLTPEQIQAALPGFYDANHLAVGETIHPGQQVVIPEAIVVHEKVIPSYQLRYGDVLWNVVKEHYKRVTPELVQAVAQASGLADMNHYYAGDTIIFPWIPETPQAPTPASEQEQPAKTVPDKQTAPQQPEASKNTPNKPPVVNQETATWKAKKGPEILSMINILSQVHEVPPATAAGWLRRANPEVDLTKLKPGTKLKLPGISKDTWRDFGRYVQHMDNVEKLVQASQKEAAAPGLQHPVTSEVLQQNYFRMPEAPNGEYVFANSNPEVRAGSKALIDTCYTVALRWNELHPESKLRFGDFNASEGHASHEKGVDVDITTIDQQAANIHGNREKSIELAKMLADTGVVEVIFYNDPAVIKAFNDYVKEKGLPGRMEPWPNHYNHFHLRILSQFKLATIANSPPPVIAPFTPAPQVAAPESAPQPKGPYSIETNPLSKSGVTAQQIDAFLAERAPMMAGLGAAFKQIEKQYGINAIYAVAHAANESAWGTSQIARAKNNLFGRNAYDSSPMDSALSTNSYTESVLEYGAFLKNAYLTEPGQPGVPGQKEAPGVYFRGFTLKGVFDLYSTAQGHDQIIADLMNEIDPQIRAK